MLGRTYEENENNGDEEHRAQARSASQQKRILHQDRRYLLKSDGMRRPVSGRDAVRSQVIDVLNAQIKGDRQ